MAAGKGILAILAKGKPMDGPPMGSPSDEPDAGSKGDSVGERASQDVLDAIDAKDAAGLYDALERVVKACQGEDDSGDA